MTKDRSTAVVITARNAAKTAARAVSSALRQDVVREVVFIDDASTDFTSDVAASEDDGSGRLKIIRLNDNVGPSRARNIAIAASASPFICILDADDYMAPRRLESLFEAAGSDDWDLVADDLYFASEEDPAAVYDRLLEDGTQTPLKLDLNRFIAANVPRKDRYRREFGFLKPIIRRSFLEAHRLRYDERLRLGEDFVLYTECLLQGAMFRVVAACGYFAIERRDSLSSLHRTDDVEALSVALGELHEKMPTPATQAAFRQVMDFTRNNLAFRKMLDAKRRDGLYGFIREAAKAPASLPFVARSILDAKSSAARKALSDVWKTR